MQLLNTQYVTPFDREDIYELATAIDDVVDYIEEAADLLGLYGVDSPTKARGRPVPDPRPRVRAALAGVVPAQGHARRPGGARCLEKALEDGPTESCTTPSQRSSATTASIR